jgi:cytochrome c oxidase cbb3-type subunit 3
MFRNLKTTLFALALVSLTPSIVAGQAGPFDRQRPDEDSADRGRGVYAQQCINCHGLDIKGTENGPDLIRSVAVLRDLEGSEIGPAMSGLSDHPSNLPGTELADISHFLKQQIEATARNRNPSQPPNVLTGNVESGRSFFSGGGGCTACHSATGDLAGVGGRYSPVNLQQRFLFPRGGGREQAPTRVTVTPPTGPAITGDVEFLNDFFVSLTDGTGNYHSFRRRAGMRVESVDPYQGHWDLLARITDRNIHDVVTYLETLK